MEYFDNGDRECLDVILHGSSKGFKTSESIQKTFQTDKDLGSSVVMFNFPFMDRNEIRKEGGGLDEEIATLKEVLQKCSLSNNNGFFSDRKSMLPLSP